MNETSKEISDAELDEAFEEEAGNLHSIWTPIILTDKATGRRVHISIFERELYISGLLTFEDFWSVEGPQDSQNDARKPLE